MTGGGAQPRSRARRTSLFVTCVPGLGRLLRHQLAAMDGVDVTGTGFDGGADIVFLRADKAGRAHVLRSRLAEDVFVEIGRASRAGGADASAVAGLVWRADAVQRALSVWADEVRPLASSMTFRVLVSVLTEARFRRAELRRAAADLVGRDKSRWRFADPAQLEFGISEFHDGHYVAGLRLGDASALPDAGRGAQPHRVQPHRHLPPALAAAMVELAAVTASSRQAGRTLLDPCCGFGTILAEALAAGWAAEGTDVDAGAVATAARNASGASVALGDVRELLMPDESVSACVSNLPSGSQDWSAAALAEMSRVTRSGGSVVLLVPELPRAVVPATLRLRRQVPVRLARNPSTIWVFRRA
jgi:23S rRNA G2445 N2-methylase RlmL